ncbi:hypothetical protein ACHAXR_007207 [Thalassiosira sp. AJA248-18]
MRTLSTDSKYDASTKKKEVDTTNPTIENVLDATIVRSSAVLEGGNSNDNNFDTEEGESQKVEAKTVPTSTGTPKQHQDKQTYLGNPSVTPTALAHSLWQSTILPYQDTVIDATCGNGKDCLALARMLFPSSNGNDGGSETTNETLPPQPHLIGIDIQSRAIHNTKRSLLSSLPSHIYYNHVTLLEQSHEHLIDLVPDDKRSSVGLVCYNLGFLPGAPSQDQPDITLNYKEYAALLLRVGGLLSIMTYPGSNLEESIVVEHFAEGLAMLTSRDLGGWRGYAERIPNYDSDGGRVRSLVTQSLERIVVEGTKKQTWRAFVHKPMGRPLSPVLVTAMRIK